MKELRNFLIILCLISCQIGAIRRDDDPIAKTQTSPIAYSEKMEETKDGEKSAPTPFFRHYEKESFLIDPPVSDVDTLNTETQDELPYVPKLGEPIPDYPAEAQEEEREWWFNETSPESQVQEPAQEDVRQY